MKSLLRSFDNATEYLNVDTIERELLPAGQKVVGWFKMIHSLPCMLVVEHERLLIKYNHTSIEINETTEANTLPVANRVSQFELMSDEGFTLKFTYEHEQVASSEAPFDYIEDEDFNWGLFLSNIVNDHSRTQALIKRFSA